MDTNADSAASFAQPSYSPGILKLPPLEQMTPAARKWRLAYARTPGAPLIQREFGFYSLDAWREQGMPQDVPLEELFGFDPEGVCAIQGLGWCEAALEPAFEVKILEERGDQEVVQDDAGRQLLCFKGRRSGFMPTYLAHPVQDLATWERNVHWRMDPQSPERIAKLEALIPTFRQQAAEGRLMVQRLIGGYMYLRSLIGPEEVLYAFYEDPELVHACMRGWFELADAVVAFHQQHVSLDELFLAEDICFKSGPLVSPDMMRRFLFPYYQQLISNARSRQLDKARPLHVQIDTDGNVTKVIDVYREIGMDVMSPFEVAAGSDVVAVGRQYPDLVMSGGLDKRELAKGPEAIDRMLERILPPMRERGGYIPTCDHGVPAEVKYSDYLHYRKRCIELGT